VDPKAYSVDLPRGVKRLFQEQQRRQAVGPRPSMGHLQAAAATYNHTCTYQPQLS
jgi:hypothetical protein